MSIAKNIELGTPAPKTEREELEAMNLRAEQRRKLAQMAQAQELQRKRCRDRFLRKIIQVMAMAAAVTMAAAFKLVEPVLALAVVAVAICRFFYLLGLLKGKEERDGR